MQNSSLYFLYQERHPSIYQTSVLGAEQMALSQLGVGRKVTSVVSIPTQPLYLKSLASGCHIQC
jgi:hypothetical protein